MAVKFLSSENIDGVLTFSTTGTFGNNASITHYTNNYLYIRGGSAGLVVGDNVSATRALFSSSNFITWEVNAVAAMHMNSSRNLGIGTSSPLGSSKLHVSSANGTAYTSNAQLRISGGATNNNRATILFSDDALSDGKLSYYPASGTSAYFSLSARGTEADFIVKADGNIGIGTASPTAKLEIVGSNGANIFRGNFAGSADIFMGFDNANPYLTLQDNSNVTTHLFQSNVNNYIVNSNVGIGTTTPNEKLVVGTTGGTQNIEISNSFIQSFNRSGSPGYASLYFYASGYAFNVGNVGIGTTSPSDLLHLRKSSGDAALRIETVTGGDPTIYFNSSAANRSGLIRYQDNGTNMGRIEYVHNGDRIAFQAGSATGETMSIKNGAVGIGTTSPTAKLDISGMGSGGVGIRIKDAQNVAGNYYYGFMFDGTDVRGLTQSNIFYAGGSVNANTTIATWASMRIDTPYLNSGASVTHNFGIYQSSALQKNYFAGNVGIAIDTPQAKLQVNGAVDTFSAHFGGQNNTNGQFQGISLGYAEATNAAYRKVGIVAQAKGDGAARQDLHFLVDTVADSNSAGIADSKMHIEYDTGNVVIAKNLGIGGRPPDSSWGSDSDIIQFGAGDNDEGFIGWRAIAGADELNMGWNCYNDNSNWKYDSGNPAGLYQQKNGSHTFYGAASGSADANITWHDQMYIDTGGDVGIGDTSPGTALQAFGSASKGLSIANQQPTIAFTDTDTGSRRAYIAYEGGSHQFYLSSPESNGIMTFQTGGFNERMRITSAGNVGIGTNAPSVPLQVNGQQKWHTTNADGNELRGFFNPGGAADDAEFSVYKADGATEGVVWRGTGNSYIRIDSTSLKFINFYYGPSNVGQIVTGGSNVLYQSNSDYRLKENVVEMTGALDRVSQLKPSRYNFISNPEEQVDGFMAHELQEVVPQAVSGQKDEMNEDGTPKYQGVDHSQIVPLLVGAIKELKAEIENLKSQIQ